MARVTIEDCSRVINSRFELVVLAAQRAKEISSGAKLTVPRDNDKDAVVALREIAARNLDSAALKEAVIKKYLTMPLVDNEDVAESDDALEIAKDMNSSALEAQDMEGMSYQDEELEEE